MPMYLIERCQNTLYVCNMDVRINQRWSRALDVPIRGQSLAETDLPLVQSLVHKKCELWRHRRAKNFQGVIEAAPHLLRYVVLSSICLGRWGSGSLLARGWGSGEYKHKWQNNIFDHLDTVYCDSEIIILLHRSNIRFFEDKTIKNIRSTYKINGTVIIINWIYIILYCYTTIKMRKIW